MSDLHRDLVEVVEAVRIASDIRYSIAGEDRVVPMPGVETASAAGKAPLHPVPEALQHDLYTRLYCRSGASSTWVDDELGDRTLVAALSQANTGHGTWEPGWVVQGLPEEGRIPVRKEGLTLWVTSAQVRSQHQGHRPGTRCRVRMGKELREMMPGYYFAIGDGNERDERDEDELLVRLYWNVSPEGAVALIRALTSAWNRIRIPFRTKVINHQSGYPRADAGVAYLDKRYFPAARAELPVIYREMRPLLRPDVPRFTKRLAPGLGLAEDPGHDESFGQHRCRVIAQALWLCFERGIAATDARVAEVAARFAELGLDPQRPYLRPGSIDDYAPLAGPGMDGTPAVAAAAPRQRGPASAGNAARARQTRNTRKRKKRR
jgi:hypothetical protein